MSCMKSGAAIGCLHRSVNWPCMRHAVAEQVRVSSWEQRRSRGRRACGRKEKKQRANAKRNRNLPIGLEAVGPDLALYRWPDLS